MFNRMALLLDQSPVEMALDIKLEGPGIKGTMRWRVGKRLRIERFRDQTTMMSALGHVADGILLHYIDDETISLQPLTGGKFVVQFRYIDTTKHWWYRKFKSQKGMDQWVEGNQDWIEIGDNNG